MKGIDPLLATAKENNATARKCELPTAASRRPRDLELRPTVSVPNPGVTEITRCVTSRHGSTRTSPAEKDDSAVDEIRCRSGEPTGRWAADFQLAPVDTVPLPRVRVISAGALASEQKTAFSHRIIQERMAGARTWPCAVDTRQTARVPFPGIAAKVPRGIPAAEHDYALSHAVIAQLGLARARSDIAADCSPCVGAPLPNHAIRENSLCETSAEQDEGVALNMVDDAMTASREREPFNLCPDTAVPEPHIIEVAMTLASSGATANQVGSRVTGMINELMMGASIGHSLSVRSPLCDRHTHGHHCRDSAELHQSGGQSHV